MNIPELLSQSLAVDENVRKTAQQQLEQIVEDPSSIQLFCGCYQEDTHPKNRNRYLTYINMILEKHWEAYPPEQQMQIYQELDNYVKITEDLQNIRTLAEMLAKLFIKAGQDFDSPIFQALFTSPFHDYVFYWFAVCIDDIPNEVVQKSFPNLLEIANWGLTQPNFSKFADSIQIILTLIQLTEDFSIFAPIFEFLVSLIPNESKLPNESKGIYWAIISQLLTKQIITLDLFDVLVESISKSTCTEAINCFNDILAQLSPEQLLNVLMLDAEILTNKLSSEGTLEEDDFALLYTAISEIDAKKLIFTLIQNLIAGDEPHQCAGIYLFGPILEASNIAENEEVQFIFTCIQTALQSESSVFQEAALRIIDKFESASSEMIAVFPDLIQLTVNYLPSQDDKIRSLAYHATETLLNECDSEIEGFLPAIWDFLTKGMVPDDSLPDFIALISEIIKKTESLDDEIADAILGWLETFYTEEKSVTLRSAALLLNAALISNDDSLESLLIPPSQATLNEAFESGENDSIRNAYLYLQAIASTLKERSGEIIQPFAEYMKSAMTEGEQFKLLALDTASIYAGYANDTSLNEIIIPLVTKMIQGDDEIEQSAACDALKYLSRILKDNQVAFDLYQSIVAILNQEVDQELLKSALSAAKSMYKRCIDTNREKFLAITFDYLSKLMSGNVAFLEGCESIFTHPKMIYLIEHIMSLFSVFFKSNPGDVSQICGHFIEWLGQANEDTAFPIISTLADAVEFCNVNEAIPAALCQYVQEKGASIVNPDLQQNISYFFALLCRKNPEFAVHAKQIMPLIVDWWNRALAKSAGYKEVLDNIASFYLSYAVIDPELPDDLICGALKQIPPTDLLETADMIKSSITLLNAKQGSPQIMLETALALAKIFTESQSQMESRKIPEEVLAQANVALKQLMGIPEIQQVVFGQYIKAKSKKEKLENALQ